MKVQQLSYRDYWGYYWRITSRHTIPGIAEWDEKLTELIIRTCDLKRNADVLDLGCAGGDQLLLFARKGHSVTGVDLVPSLIQYAREAFDREGLPARLVVGDMRVITYEGEFDLCMMLSGTFGLPAPTEDRSLLERIYRSLRAGGCAFIDYLPLESFCKKAHSKTWHEIEGGYALNEEWFHVPTSTYRTKHKHVLLDGRIIEAYENDAYGANEIIRCYSAYEIEELGKSVGFKVKAHLSKRHMDEAAYKLEEDEARGIVVFAKGG